MAQPSTPAAGEIRKRLPFPYLGDLAMEIRKKLEEQDAEQETAAATQ